LILTLGPVSGAHFNPVVTLADRVYRRIDSQTACWYVVAQTVGACIGCMIANLMFDLSAVTLSTHNRSSAGLALGEVVATFGLLLTIIGVVRSGRTNVVAFAVGAYIAAAYWFTSSTSFANPAVTIGRTLTNTFAGIKPSSVPLFVVCQLLGAAIAVGLFVVWYPDLREPEMLMEHT
jgi:glycerol uptake facilitator-like aquaporin